MAAPGIANQSTVLEQGSYLTFQAANMHFALAAQHVRYITAQFDLERVVHRPDGRKVKVFQFERQNVSCFDFSEIIGAQSPVLYRAELQETLGLRRQDHIDWLDALEHSLKTGEPFKKAKDPHACAFGRWYDSFSTEDEDLAEILAGFDAPHKKLHALAGELLEMEDREEAIQRLERARGMTLSILLDIFDDAAKRLDEMQRQVAVIIEADQRLFAIELDQIEDLVHFSENQLDSTRDICRDLPVNADIIKSFYHQKDSPLYLVIDLPELTRAI